MLRQRLWWALILIILVPVSIVTADQAVTDKSNSEGRWNGTWHSSLFKYTFIQNGNVISGNYTPLNQNLSVTGSLNGALSDDGRVMSGIWADTEDFRFIISDDKSSLNGTWGYHETAENYTGNNTDYWTGVWNSSVYSIRLLQDEKVVTGTILTLDPRSAEYGLLNGTLSEDGRVYSGRCTESGEFIFHLSEDGSVFNGTYKFGSEEARPGDVGSATRIE
jgi:hypothetical protein